MEFMYFSIKYHYSYSDRKGINYIIVCRGSMCDPCFVMQYLVSFIVLHSSRCRRESKLLYFNCMFAVL